MSEHYPILEGLDDEGRCLVCGGLPFPEFYRGTTYPGPCRCPGREWRMVQNGIEGTVITNPIPPVSGWGITGVAGPIPPFDFSERGGQGQ